MYIEEIENLKELVYGLEEELEDGIMTKRKLLWILSLVHVIHSNLK